MDYKLSSVHQKLKELSDKMGSDYFVLPVFLNFFETATYDFIGEKLKIIEKTQEITDDIRQLIPAPTDIDIIVDPNDSTRYIAPLPSNYHRVVAYDIFYADDKKCRRADLIRQAEYNTARLNPNTMPTAEYPLILQFDSTFQIDAGSAVPLKFKLTFCKKPTFATTGKLSTRIVNLSDEAIEKILKMTVTSLFNKTADERSGQSYQLQETYRKVFK
jgi:hypothetical protein